jgi:molecular chaperone DnaJ
VEHRNRTVKVRIPPGVEDGQRIRVKGRGVPAGRKSATGDLLVTVEVVVPDTLTDEQRSAVEALAEVVEPPARDALGV